MTAFLNFEDLLNLLISGRRQPSLLTSTEHKQLGLVMVEPQQVEMAHLSNDSLPSDFDVVVEGTGK